MRNTTLGIFLALACTASTVAHAQTRWKEIGKTSSGNKVFVDPRSVTTSKGITSGRVQMKFTQPVDAGPGVRWYLSKHDVMVDCSKRYLASKSNVYYGDPAGTRVVKREVNKIPGFGPPIAGSLTQVVVDYFCKR